jgi:hypothetical protein
MGARPSFADYFEDLIANVIDKYSTAIAAMMT